jgi:hypothetical protein
MSKRNPGSDTIKRPNPTTSHKLRHGRLTRFLFVSKQCHARLDANGKPSYFVPRHTGATYGKAKHGGLTL